MAILLSVLMLVLMIGALVDIIPKDDSQIRYLPKLVWILLVVLLTPAGPIVWFAVGREWNGEGIRMPQSRPRPQAQPRPSAPSSPPRPFGGDERSTEQQLADLDREIEEWRLREEIAKRQKEAGDDV